MNRTPSVIINANDIGTLLPIRVLARRGIPVIPVFGKGGLDRYSHVVRSSRFVKSYYTFDESDYAANMIGCLQKIGESLGRKSVLMMASDRDMIVVSEYRELLDRYFHLILPPHETLSAILNKQQFYSMAQEKRLPIPQTFFPSSIDDIPAIAEMIRYPCIIKPPWRDAAWQMKYHNQKIVMANNAQQLVSAFQGVSESFDFLSVQEVIEGSEQNITCSFTFADNCSNPLVMFALKKNRQYPPYFGNSSLVERVSDAEVVDLTKKICKELGLVGYVSIEFKKDSRDGEFKIIEITPSRFNRQTGLSEVAGISFPGIWYSYLVGEPFNTTSNDLPCKWISEINEIRGFWEYYKRREYTLVSWLQSYKGLKMGEIFSKDDLLPILILPFSFLQWTRSLLK